MATLLLNKLLASAKAIEDGDLDLAESVFKEIKCLNDANTSTATRKLVRFYAEALIRRLYKLYPRNPTPLAPSTDSYSSGAGDFFLSYGLQKKAATIPSLMPLLEKRKSILSTSLIWNSIC